MAANATTPADSPAIATANLYQATAQALNTGYHNAVNNQQQANLLLQAATVQGVATLLSIDTASDGARLPRELEQATAAIAVPPVSIPSPEHLHGADDFAYGARAVSDVRRIAQRPRRGDVREPPARAAARRHLGVPQSDDRGTGQGGELRGGPRRDQSHRLGAAKLAGDHTDVVTRSATRALDNKALPPTP